MPTQVLDPISIEILDIKLIKYGRNPEYINLLPQMIQFNIYQSIFQPLMRAELTIADTIALQTNFPVLGEEKVRITFRSTDQMRSFIKDQPPKNLEFVVVSTNPKTFDDTGKITAYILNLVSVEQVRNSQIKIEKAYFDTYTNVVEELLKNEIDGLGSTKRLGGITGEFIDNEPEISANEYHFVVPSMHPIEAINWICDRAVPLDTTNYYYTFFERFDRDGSAFFMGTIQAMISAGKRRLQNFREEEVYKKFIYASNYNKNMDNKVREYLSLPPEEPVATKFITNLSMNKRFDTIEKILSGFYENIYTEIDIFNRQIRTHKTQANNQIQVSRRIMDRGLTPDILADHAVTITPYQTNTPKFIDDMVTDRDDNGTVAKNVYKIRIGQGDRPDEPDLWPNKIGEVLRIKSAFSQFSISLTLPGDTRVQAGDLIQVDVPLSSGFTENPESEQNSLDPYLSGFYLVTEIKHSIYTNNRYTMVLNVNKDAFNKPLYIGRGETVLPKISNYYNNLPSNEIPRDR